jgi:predicted metal-dependent hydrolase
MPDSKIIEIKGVGSVLFEKSRRARHVSISVRPLKGVRVAVPHRVSFGSAEEFVYMKLDWIIKHLQRMMQYEKMRGDTPVTTSEIDKKEASRKLTLRLDYLARKFGFSFNRVFIRNQRTRWGSCSHNNNISLNIKLLRLPEELMDYVILHELTHTRIKNHSREFWTELDKHIPDSKKIASRLRKYRLELF